MEMIVESTRHKARVPDELQPYEMFHTHLDAQNVTHQASENTMHTIYIMRSVCIIEKRR